MTNLRIAPFRLASFALVLLAACGVAPTTPSSDAAPAGDARAEGTDDRFIVMFRPGTANVDAAIDAMTRGQGITVRHRYYSAIQGFAGSIPAAALEGVQRNPTVQLVEADGEVHLNATQQPISNSGLWGLDRIDQRSGRDGVYTYDLTGSGVDVYIVDTGILTAHSQFGGRAVAYRNFLDGTTNSEDCNGHGTHVAGTVGGSTFGVAKNVTLYAARVFGCSGGTSTSVIIAAVDAITQIKVDNPGRRIVGNMSLGGGASSTFNTSVNNSVDKGVVWVVAAGNSNADACSASPASAAKAITVGASTDTDTRASFSNFGSCVDLFAPGEYILSAWYTSTTAGAYLNGTSMASPHVAGVAALYLEANATATAAAVHTAIVANATPNVVSSAGTGSPNLLLHSRFGPPPVTHLLSVTRTGPGTGTVTGTGISCGTDCSETVVENSSVTLTATPASGSTFGGWSGCASTSGTSCTVTMDAAKTVEATFNLAPAIEFGISDIDGSRKAGNRNWSATATFEVRTASGGQASGSLVGGAVVTVQRTGASTGTSSCTTSSTSGRCSITVPGLSNINTSITFSVTNVTRSGYAYNASLNKNTDGDSSNGTSITINR